MIRTGAQYRDSIRDGRRIWINGERVHDVTSHPMFKPLVDIRARIYDMQHEDQYRDITTYQDDSGERHAIGLKLPYTQDDWHAKRRATDALLDDIGGVVTRVGDETVGEMWSLFDGQDVLNEVNPMFSDNIKRHIERVHARRPLPCLGQYRSQGRPLQSGRRTRIPTCCCTSCGDRCRHRRARREIRDRRRLCQPGLYQADHRELGRCGNCPITRLASSVT
jgi:hypothetical protein